MRADIEPVKLYMGVLRREWGRRRMRAETKQREAPVRERSSVGARAVGARGIIITASFLIALSVLLLYALVQFWPAAPPAARSDGATGATVTTNVSAFRFLWWGDIILSREKNFLLIVVLAGATGAMLHGLRSLGWYVGERYLFRSWLLYYFLLPLIGAVLATIVYLVVRAGLLSGATAVDETNPFGFAAVAGLVGLFSAQAAEKLKQVFETLFTQAPKGNEALDQAQAQRPTISAIEPLHGPVGTRVTITGANLKQVTDVKFAGRTARFTIDSNNQITATVPEGAAGGPVTLAHPSGTATATDEFEVT